MYRKETHYQNKPEYYNSIVDLHTYVYINRIFENVVPTSDMYLYLSKRKSLTVVGK